MIQLYYVFAECSLTHVYVKSMDSASTPWIDVEIHQLHFDVYL